MIRSLQCDIRLGLAYKSPSQIARVVTEHWCSDHLYCAACDSDHLSQMPANTKATDFKCLNCLETYQLKSQRHLNLKRVPDGAYSTMIAALRQNSAPNLLILNYGPAWEVKNLFLFPSVVFTQSVLEKRPALSKNARRAGWIGCNIILSGILPEARIPIVHDNEILPALDVRRSYRMCRELEQIQWDLRGWTLDVLSAVKQLGRQEFSLSDLYVYQAHLERLHPGNKNVKAKIRQQLQVLRDLGYIEFRGNGSYCLKLLY